MRADLFGQYIAKYKKRFSTIDEYNKRLKIFSQNIKKIEVLNQIHNRSSVIYDLNEFTYMSEQEFRNQKLMNFNAKRYEYGMEVLKEAKFVGSVNDVQDPPEEFDWRTKNVVTPVKDQGSCGSCWAFSAMQNIESQWAIKGNNLTSFSAQQLIDCDNQDCGCLGGWPQVAMKHLIDNGGLSTEADYPYCAPPFGDCFSCVTNKTFCRPFSPYCNRTCLDAPKTVKLSSFELVSSDEEVIKAYLFKNGPLSIGINALWLQFYSSGVSNPWYCDKEVDHAVLLVGYGTHRGYLGDTPYWLIKNSWAEGWGEKGYFRIYRGKGVCGVNTLVVNAVL
ncbi:cysteine protease [Acrasis kona]|uniref:Cysteine protease n=1 Tax=Acrasis kona TaxID=1008807 RepID=A0AAW2ZFP8_9EUKA